MKRAPTMPVHEPLVQIQKQFQAISRKQDGQMYYFLAANTSAKQAIILLHGVTGNKLDMVVLGRRLAEQGYAVYAPDLPGHGNAPPIIAKDFKSFGQWLHQCIASLHIRPAMVIGNSFGAAVCYSYAQQGFLPEGSCLILNCPTPDISAASRLLRNAGRVLPPKVALKLYNSQLIIAARIAYLHVSGDDNAKYWLRESEYYKRSFIDARMPNRMSSLLETQNPFHGPVLPVELQKRVVYIIGDRDNVVTRSTLPTMARILPHAARYIVPGVGHILHFDAWKACGDIAVACLKKLKI